MEENIRKFIERGQYQPPSGTPEPGWFNVERMSKFIADSVKGAAWQLWLSLLDVTGTLCIVASIAGVILYVFGYKKGIRISGASIGIYSLLKIITVAISG